MRLSLVIPCYNESGNIPLIVERLRQILGDRQDIEVILVENGSRDDSSAVMKRELARATDARLRTHMLSVNKGYGFGIMSGLSVANGDVLAWTHADMQTDPVDVLTAFDLYRHATSQRSIVKGRRQHRSMAESLFTWGMQKVASMALRIPLEDINAQPKLFDRALYEAELKGQAPDDFSLDLFLLYTARVRGYRILTVPVDFAKRLHGEAKGGGSWKTRQKLVRRTFAYIFALRARVAKVTPNPVN